MTEGGGEGVQNSLNLCDVIYERPRRHASVCKRYRKGTATVVLLVSELVRTSVSYIVIRFPVSGCDICTSGSGSFVAHVRFGAVHKLRHTN